jgi:tetratricopeptide (TPR) repeat protein
MLKFFLVILLLFVVFLSSRIGIWLALLSAFGLVLCGVLVLYFIGKKLPPNDTTSAHANTDNSDRSKDAAEKSINSASPTAAVADPVELAPAIDALKAGRFEQVVELAQPYVDDMRDSVRIDALRLIALGHTRLLQYAEAYPYWLELAKTEPSSWNHLQVASTAAMLAQVDAAEEAYALCQRSYTQEQGDDPDKGLAIDGTYQANYLSSLDRGGNPDVAFKYLDELASFYCKLGITDSTFLHIRKMPPFDTFLEQSLLLVRKVKDEDALTTWYRNIYMAVDEQGQAAFARHGVPH